MCCKNFYAQDAAIAAVGIDSGDDRQVIYILKTMELHWSSYSL